MTSLVLRSNSICCIVFPFNKMLGKSVLERIVSWAVSGLSSLELIPDKYDTENRAHISIFSKSFNRFSLLNFCSREKKV